MPGNASAGGEANAERGAGSGGQDVEGAALGLGEGARERKAETGAGRRAVVMDGGAAERFEDGLLLAFRDTRPEVADEHGAVATASPGRRDLDPAHGRVVGSVP